MVTEYLKQLHKKYQKGDAREESYYSTLETFLKNYSETKRKKKIDVTILPKQTEAGNPDFRIWDGKQDVVGYIEAKDIGKNLDDYEDTKQIKRYLKTFPNVILTNFTEFRLYRDGKPIDKVFIAYHREITQLHTTPVIHNEDKFFELLNKFFAFSLPRTFTAKTLAVELAKRTRFLKDEIISSEIEAENPELIGFYEAFKEYLIAGLNEDDFADLYSQTITYGLFAARLRAGKNFTRRDAINFIPKTIGILRDVFRFISSADLPRQMETIIDDIASVLAAADARKILDQYYREGKGSDPVLHFYETFLAEYDPETREKRGVYYTPEPVVSFIVRSLHIILKEKFNKPLGLADKNVTLLDPAGGTLSFNTKAIEIAIEEFVNSFGEGGKKKFIKEHILENFYSFELMMAPYAIGHMKLSFLLEELGYVMKDEERAKFYLTNTLEMKELEETKLPGMSSLSHESHEAGKVKKDVPILVVHGNPPYSGHSSNKGVWISGVIKDYYKVDGKPLGEKNPKWLQDDYVKFIRFAQWKIDQMGEGVLAFITNHSYLDNPTFRGMRQSLMNSFNEIFVLDLHGNSLKKEKSPDGSADENVFDIMQGVAIAFFIKNTDSKTRTVKHSDLFGLREIKYDWLDKNDIKKVNWNILEPIGEFYLFIPQDQTKGNVYSLFNKITDILPVNTVGVVTSRDSLVVDADRLRIENRIRQFVNKKIEDNVIRDIFNLKEKKNWNLKQQREKVRNEDNWYNEIVRFQYRPFDLQWIFYNDNVLERSRKEIMKYFLSPNIGLITNRQIRLEKICHSWITDQIVDLHIIETANASAYVFPLYIYPGINKKDLFSDHESGEKKPNINSELFAELKSKYKKEVTPEEIFYYIYAVLYSNTYRTKYAEFLKIDFPRIPFTSNHKLFIKLAKLGKQLADLHLLKSAELNKTISKFSGKGDSKVTQRPKYEDERVYINSTQYFTNVKEDVWKYQIGGYQVCDKWLKDRKGPELSLDEIQTYCKIVTSLSKTIEIQKKIDENYDGVEK
jgi:predicted helicase